MNLDLLNSRVQKNPNILWINTIFNEHPVSTTDEYFAPFDLACYLYLQNVVKIGHRN